MTLAKSIRSSTKWLLAGNIGNSIFNFLFGIILARLLVPEDFGLLVTVQIFTGVAGLIAGGGMGQALIRSKEASTHDFNVVFTIQFTICILIYLFFYTIAPYFARWYHEPIYESLLRVTAINFLFRPVVGNHSIWLQREMRFKARSIIAVISGMIASIASIIMAWSGLGVWSLAFSGIIGSFISWLLLTFQTPLRPTFTFDSATARKVSGTGIKFSLLDIVSYLRTQTNNFIIGRMAGPAAVGLFNKAESLAMLPFTTISSSVYQPVFRALAIEQDNIDKSKYIFLRTVTLLLVYTLPAYIAFSWLAYPFINVVYGAKWSDAAAPLSVLTWVWVFSSFGQPAGALLAAQNRLGQELVVQINSLILNSIACVIGFRWGLMGIAWGLLIARLYSFSHNLWLVRKCIPIGSRDLLSIIKPGAILGGLLIFSLILINLVFQNLHIERNGLLYILVSLGVGGITYTIAFLVLPLADIKNEKERLMSILRLPK